jgi:hypothetical protein
MGTRSEHTIPLPPRIPNTADGLTRAITLLGAFAKDQLRQSKRAELCDLIGKCPPDATIATAWKRMLKDVRADEIWSGE